MRVFISWSGQHSKAAAEIFREWIPNVLQLVEPFISSQDIDTGVPWFNEIKRALDQTRFGIVCLTKANCRSPWLLYEIGALAHRVEHVNVVPILLDLGPRDVPTPISLFQAIEVNEKAILRLVESLNSHLGDSSLPEGRLKTAFKKWWPDLESQLKAIPNEQDCEVPLETSESEDKTSFDESVNEILELVRGVSVKTDSIDRLLKRNRNEEDLRAIARRVSTGIGERAVSIDAPIDKSFLENDISQMIDWENFPDTKVTESDWEKLSKNIGYFVKAIQKVEKPKNASSTKKGRKEESGGQDVDASKNKKTKE